MHQNDSLLNVAVLFLIAVAGVALAVPLLAWLGLVNVFLTVVAICLAGFVFATAAGR